MDVDIKMEICDDELEMSDDELKKELQMIDEEEEKEKEKEKEKAKTDSESVKKKLSENCKKEEGEIDNSEVSNKNDDTIDNEALESYKQQNRLKNVDMFRNKMIDYKRLKKPLEVTKDSDPAIVGREIAYRLHEIKMKLICNVALVLGVELAMEVFEETKKIVLQGGLKTDNGDRKRSPGGTFLYLMKSRGYASKRQIKEIFKFEEHAKKFLRKKKMKSERVTSQYLPTDEKPSQKHKRR